MFFGGTSNGTKPSLSASISVSDYLTHYATVTSMPTTAKVNSSSIQAWKLPWTDNDNASLKLKTVSGTLTIKNKVVNHAGNTWYEIDTGSSTRGFVYGPSITLLPYYTGVKETSVGADNAAVAGTCLNPGGVTLKTGGFYLSTRAGAVTYGTKKTDNIPSSYQTAASIPCTYNFKNEYGLTLSPGTTYYYVLYVTDSNDKSYYSEERSFTTSSVKVTGITVSPASKTVNLGGTQQLSATVTPTNATNKAVSWKSSNTAVATVSASGMVTAKAVGTATITATAADGSGKYATASITVTCNHSAGTVTIPAVSPTCTATGLTAGKKCSACGAVTVAQTTVAATGHTYGNWTQTKAPTCTATGTERRDCSKCDHYETRTVAATGHSYTSVVTAPTCTEKGYTTHTCACGDSYVDSYVAATGHSYGNWTQTKAPTCTATGTERRDCSKCDHYETRTVAATGHSYTSVVTAPTCTEKGYTIHTCACGDNYVSDEVPALGHDITDGVCDRCGEAFLYIVKQPMSVTVAAGETAAVTVEAVGDSLTYTWYYKNADSGSFQKTTAFTGKTYSVTMSSGRDGRQVYCIVKDAYGNSVQTDVATLSMAVPETAAIVTQPVSVWVDEGETAAVTVDATGDGLTYKWYYKNPGSSKYSYTSSFKGNTYSITMSEARSGRKVYCKITDAYGNTVKSKTVSLNMKMPLEIVTQPKSVRVAKGATAKVTVKAQGDGLTYMWYYKNPGESEYSYTSSFTGSSYSVTMNAARNGRYVYCEVYDRYGNMVKTKTVSLRMK